MNKKIFFTVMCLIVFLFIASCIEKKVEFGDNVTVNYIIKLENGSIIDTNMQEVAINNEIFDANKKYSPLMVKIGENKVIKGFEEALINMKEGEEKNITIPAEKAYGKYSKMNIGSIDLVKSILKNESVENYSKGSVLEMNGFMVKIIEENSTHYMLKLLLEEGGIIKNRFGGVGRVIKINETDAVVDFNHPLAGQNLTAYIKVLSINKYRKKE